VEEDDGRDVQQPSAGDRLYDALETMVEADLGGVARGPATRDPLPSPLPSSCPAWPVAAAARWKLRSRCRGPGLERLAGAAECVQPLQAAGADRGDVGAVGKRGTPRCRAGGRATGRGNRDRAPEIADLVRRPARGGAGTAGDLSQFAEQEDRRAPEPADHRVGLPGGDVVAVEGLSGCVALPVAGSGAFAERPCWCWLGRC